MSATPIPRTLSLTLFGDLDLSLITDLPKDRKKIITKVIDPKNREKAYGFIRNEVKKGRQVFVICPRIEQSMNNVSLANMQINELRKLEIKSVKAEYEKLSKKIFPDLRVAMLHGKMKTKEKEKIMREFQEKQADILVSTSVVEVGVDIPNATIMMIEDADRFGLAQLYQFRGRVGRGAHQSYCFLFTESFSKNAYNRLKLIAEAKNGFELAEKDLKMRGPGEFLGSAQTGMPDLAMKALQNPELVKNAREAALLIIHQDPTLRHHKNLDDHLKQFLFQLHRE
jgi:ATP-dependent DNA helicase RecG